MFAAAQKFKLESVLAALGGTDLGASGVWGSVLNSYSG